MNNESFMKSFNEAIFRDSKMMLDAIGIRVSFDDLPSTKHLNNINRAIMPRGLWKRAINRLHFWLFPQDLEELITLRDALRLVQKTEFLNRVMDEAKARMDNAENSPRR